MDHGIAVRTPLEPFILGEGLELVILSTEEIQVFGFLATHPCMPLVSTLQTVLLQTRPTAELFNAVVLLSLEDVDLAARGWASDQLSCLTRCIMLETETVVFVHLFVAQKHPDLRDERRRPTAFARTPDWEARLFDRDENVHFQALLVKTVIAVQRKALAEGQTRPADLAHTWSRVYRTPLVAFFLFECLPLQHIQTFWVETAGLGLLLFFGLIEVELDFRELKMLGFAERTRSREEGFLVRLPGSWLS